MGGFLFKPLVFGRVAFFIYQEYHHHSLMHLFRKSKELIGLAGFKV